MLSYAVSAFCSSAQSSALLCCSGGSVLSTPLLQVGNWASGRGRSSLRSHRKLPASS